MLDPSFQDYLSTEKAKDTEKLLTRQIKSFQINGEPLLMKKESDKLRIESFAHHPETKAALKSQTHPSIPAPTPVHFIPSELQIHCLELLEEIKQYSSDKDPILNAYIDEKCALLKGYVSEYRLGFLERELHEVSAAVNSIEVNIVKGSIKKLRDHWNQMDDKQSKADKIEKALYETPIIERAKMISNQGPANPVQEALAIHRDLWKKGMVYKLGDQIDPAKAASSFTEAKKRLEEITNEPKTHLNQIKPK